MTQTVQATVSDETYRRLLQEAKDNDTDVNVAAGRRIERSFPHE